MIKKYLSRIMDLTLLREFRMLGVFFILAFSLFIFYQAADEVSEGEYQDLETRMLYSFRDPADLSKPLGPEWLSIAMRDITALGGEAILALVTVFIIGFLYMKGDKRSVYYIIAATVGGALIGLSLKAFFFRERPDITLHMMPVTSKSFPSGHSMMSAAVYLSLAALLARVQKGYKLRIYIIGGALLLSFLIGISRIYLGVHYPSDVLAGWSAGLAWAVICWITAKYLEIKRIDIK